MQFLLIPLLNHGIRLLTLRHIKTLLMKINMLSVKNMKNVVVLLKNLIQEFYVVLKQLHKALFLVCVMLLQIWFMVLVF
ncbi:hypothetical protein DD605_06345 [Enterobacter cloacae complex sp. 3DZ3S2B]|nr:hypothetical protein DD603_13025 [Enterobacter cloacae complex sp. 2DZ2F2B]RYA45722.1 hypothetical protein DD605_06345 [Enterobacter cloacae complex sp. 3DZ3S2B]